MIGFSLIQVVFGAGWALCKLLPDAVALPANVVPEVTRFLGVMVELDVCFPVREAIGMFGVAGALYAVMFGWRLFEYVGGWFPTMSGGG